jgi:hypothetical protein
VLHPRHKLSYFKSAGWTPEWIETAEELVRTVFQGSYASHSVVDDEGKSSSRGQAVKAADIDGRLPGSAPHSPPQRSNWIRVYDVEQLSYEAGKEYKWCYCCVYRVR